MPNLVEDIVGLAEKRRDKPLMEQDSPAVPGQILMPGKDGPVDARGFCQIVGKLMYLFHKVLPEIINAVQELTNFFAVPCLDHWDAVNH